MRERWQANEDLEWPDGLFNNDTDGPDTFIRASQKILDSIWSPDTFIPNARKTGQLILDTSRIELQFIVGMHNLHLF